MRALSGRQAASCESAVTSRCRCRCGGAFHGANRVVEFLDADDPHAAAIEWQLELELNRPLVEDVEPSEAYL